MKTTDAISHKYLFNTLPWQNISRRQFLVCDNLYPNSFSTIDNMIQSIIL